MDEEQSLREMVNLIFAEVFKMCEVAKSKNMDIDDLTIMLKTVELVINLGVEKGIKNAKK